MSALKSRSQGIHHSVSSFWDGLLGSKRMEVSSKKDGELWQKDSAILPPDTLGLHG